MKIKQILLLSIFFVFFGFASLALFSSGSCDANAQTPPYAGSTSPDWCSRGKCKGAVYTPSIYGYSGGLSAGLTLYADPRITDAAPYSIAFEGSDAYAKATGANQQGGSIIFRAGIGTNQATIDDYTLCTGDTVTVWINGSANVLTEGAQWTAATDNNTTAESLKTAIAALSGISSVSRTNAVLYITPTVGASRLRLSESDGTCTTVLTGSTGVFNFVSGSTTPASQLGINLYGPTGLVAPLSIYGTTGEMPGLTFGSGGSFGSGVLISSLAGSVNLRGYMGDSFMACSSAGCSGKYFWAASTRTYHYMLSNEQVQAVVVADNGGGTPATGTITATKSYVDVTCNDGDGCTMSLSETGVIQGDRLEIVCIVGVCNFSDTAGVSETAGAISLGVYDSLTLRYINDRWVQVGTSDN